MCVCSNQQASLPPGTQCLLCEAQPLFTHLLMSAAASLLIFRLQILSHLWKRDEARCADAILDSYQGPKGRASSYGVRDLVRFVERVASKGGCHPQATVAGGVWFMACGLCSALRL